MKDDGPLPMIAQGGRVKNYTIVEFRNALYINRDDWTKMRMEVYALVTKIDHVQLVRLRDSEFDKRKAELFNKRRRDFRNLTYFHASNEAKLEIRKTILTMYVNSRPYWYQRLEQKTGKFDLRTKLFICYLLKCRIRNMWERHELRLLSPSFTKRQEEDVVAKSEERQLRSSRPRLSEEEQICEGCSSLFQRPLIRRPFWLEKSKEKTRKEQKRRDCQTSNGSNELSTDHSKTATFQCGPFSATDKARYPTASGSHPQRSEVVAYIPRSYLSK
jgi:hypothetical protein